MSGKFDLTKKKPDIVKILITGATGFLGSHLTRRLLQEGYQVIIQKRLSTDVSRIKDIIDYVQMINVDLRDSIAMNDAILRIEPDIVIHLVTNYLVGSQVNMNTIIAETNLTGTINLLEACRMAGVKKIINTSTCSVYKEKGDYLSEFDPTHPQNFYALTKLLAEKVCTFYADNYDINIVSLRLFHLYGPSDHKYRLIPYSILTLANNKSPNLTTGEQRWDFVYVEDIVDAYVKTIEAFPFPNKHEIINIGTGDPRSVRQVVEMLRSMMQVDVNLTWGSIPHRANEIWFNSANNKKAREILGWYPQTSIEDGLRYTIQWFIGL